jgi:hypothetical protein
MKLNIKNVKSHYGLFAGTAGILILLKTQHLRGTIVVKSNATNDYATMSYLSVSLTTGIITPQVTYVLYLFFRFFCRTITAPFAIENHE